MCSVHMYIAPEELATASLRRNALCALLVGRPPRLGEKAQLSGT